MLDTYLHFVTERQSIWEKRQAGEPQPWTTDPVLATRKFCNVYRIHDHGTQFVLRELINLSDTFHDCLMRCFLYRYQNRPEPWEHFKRVVGTYPTVADLSGRLQTVWGTYSAAGHPIFGSAYKMFVGKENAGSTRLAWALDLTKTYITQLFANQFLLASGPEARLNLLKTIPRCGTFMGMQILTDVGYSPWIRADENEFVVAGPGARRGAAHIEKGYSAESLAELLRWKLTDIRLPEIGRPPSLMDTQNTLCEFSKYVRWSQEPIRKKPYQPTHPNYPIKVIYPEHWRPGHEQLPLPNLI